MSDARRTGTFDIRENPELEDIIKIALRAERLTLRTNVIGKVVSTDSQLQGFDPDTQKVSVEIQYPRIVKDRENPSVSKVKDPTIVKNLPVYFPRSSSGYLTFPINIGDTGEIFVQERDPSKWYQSGEAIDPANPYTHNLAFGVFHPGLSDNANRLNDFDNTSTVLEHTDSIKIGRQAILGAARLNDAVSQAPEFQVWFAQAQTLLSALATLFNQPAPVVPSDFGLISEASEKVSVE